MKTNSAKEEISRPQALTSKINRTVSLSHDCSGPNGLNEFNRATELVAARLVEKRSRIKLAVSHAEVKPQTNKGS